MNVNSYAQGWKWGRGSIGGMEEIGPTVCDALGNVYVSGDLQDETTITFDTISISNTVHNSQIGIVKVDSNGNFIWASSTHSYGTNGCAIQSMAADGLGSLYFIGCYADSFLTVGYHDTIFNPLECPMCFVAKISPTGEVLWAKNLAPAYHIDSIGSYVYIWGVYAAVGVDNFNNVYVNGQFGYPTLTLGASVLHNHDTSGLTTDIYVARLDTAGNIIWAENFGSNGSDNSTEICVTKSGNFYIYGTYAAPGISFSSVSLDTSHGNYMYLTKINNAGTPTWAINVDNGLSYAYLTTDDNEDAYFTGTFASSSAYPLYFGHDTLISHGNEDVFLAKYSSSGNAAWARGGGSINKDFSCQVSADHCGKIWIGGRMGGNMIFGNDSIPHVLGPDSYFMAEFDTSGNFIAGTALKSGGDDESGISVDNFGNVYVGGDYESGSLIIGPDTLAGSGFEPLFIAKYNYGNCRDNDVQVNRLNLKPMIRLFPNPTSGIVNIDADEPLKLILIQDIFGRQVYRSESIGPNVQVNISDWAEGIYFVIVNSSTVSKLIKE